MTKQIVDNLQKKSGGYHCAQRIGDIRTDSQLLTYTIRTTFFS